MVTDAEIGDAGSERDDRACYVVREDERGFGIPEGRVAEFLVVGIDLVH